MEIKRIKLSQEKFKKRRILAVNRKTLSVKMLFTIFGLLTMTYLVIFIKPDSLRVVWIFLILLLATVYLLLSALIFNKRRAFTLSFLLFSVLALRYLGAGSVINLLILFAIFAAIEFYVRLRNN